MKAIMISIRPEWTQKILNGEKTIEIRKTMPKCDLPVKVYIYCTNNKKHTVAPFRFVEGWKYKEYNDNTSYANGCTANMGETINGKVVAEFTLNKITKHKKNFIDCEDNICYNFKVCDVKNAGFETDCLSLIDFDNFIEGYGQGKTLYGWHIDDLKIYDKPKELSEFSHTVEYGTWFHIEPLTRPPQSWCYVES